MSDIGHRAKPLDGHLLAGTGLVSRGYRHVNPDLQPQIALGYYAPWAATFGALTSLNKIEVARRKSEINISGPLTESKTAWKCVVLQQALLYRATMTALGCADAWNDNNTACSMLAARALLETDSTL